MHSLQPVESNVSPRLSIHHVTNDFLLCTGFEDAEVLPKLFVLMGDFTSDAAGGTGAGFAAVRENFNALAALLRTFRRIRVRTKTHHGNKCSTSQSATEPPSKKTRSALGGRCLLRAHCSRLVLQGG